ncbi:hypothetical protein [Taibaiella koreensis]|uniref:hypothetical protein n=1 Tax=Taibaiella koreensis TaxID=1268548 RepID=UPI00196984F3|nr:hypothetical protein [Taibaiella koreensis]
MPTANYSLPTTHYSLPIANCPLPITHYSLPNTQYPIPNTTPTDDPNTQDRSAYCFYCPFLSFAMLFFE